MHVYVYVWWWVGGGGGGGGTGTMMRGSTALPWSCEPLHGEKEICVGLSPGLKMGETGT